jgi:hypothetical protein
MVRALVMFRMITSLIAASVSMGMVFVWLGSETPLTVWTVVSGVGYFVASLSLWWAWRDWQETAR